MPGIRSININTMVSDTYRYMARDLDGSIYVFENKPSIATDIACDTWDVKTGKVLQITPKTPVASSSLEMGDWRESLIELDDAIYC